MDWLSQGVEVLIEKVDAGKADYDVIIVGSGYGGAVAASRLARAGRRVCVLERGREYLPGEFPNDIAHLPKHVRVARADKRKIIGEADALIDIRIGKDVSALVGSSLGGTSQLNAAVAEEARPEIFRGPKWPSVIRRDPGFLVEEYRLARRMLGVGPYDRDIAPKKLTALRKLNRKISVSGTDRDTRFRPLEVAIRQGGRAPGHGEIVPQKPCVQCGDCCSGCNYWAKNTLTMNYLPDARAHGARFYTGVSVLSVTAGVSDQSKPWMLSFRPTARQNDSAYRKARTLRADVVILAAGTFGSTEILLRSKRRGLLVASDRLGCGFSCNGDTLSFGYDQDEEVNAVGWGSGDPDKRPDKVVGPMAAGIIDLRDADRPEQRVVIEDGAIPGPMAHFAGELLTTAGMLTQLSSFRLKGDRIGRDTDPLAVSREAMDKTQVFLVMGIDAAAGQLKFGKQGDEVEGSLQVEWDKVGEQPLYQAVAGILDATRKLGGIHIPNPIWKPLPDSMAAVLSGPTPKGSLVTVHPLGGCRMADTCVDGVVNHLGQVFDTRTTTTVHEGLYVMDGAIVPSAVGINPLLTITALAERNVRMLATAHGWTIDYESPGSDPLPRVPDIDGPYRAPADNSVGVRLREKLVGRLKGDPSPLMKRQADAEHFELRLELDFRDHDVLSALQSEGRTLLVTGSVEAHASAPDAREFGEEVHLHNGPIGTECSKLLDGVLPNPTRSGTEAEKIAVKGTIALLQRDRNGWFMRFTGGLRAARYWWKLRGHDEVCREIHCIPTERGLFERMREWIRRASSLVKLAVHVGERRFMTYRLEFEGRDKHLYVIEGKKTIAFAEGINVWRSLVDLDVEIKRKGGTAALAAGRVTMDFLDAVRNRPPQIEKQPHALAAWSALASMALFVARIVIKTYIWHFRAPDYPPEPVESLQRPGPVNGVEGPDPHTFVTGDGVELLLSHYWNPAARDPKLLPVVVTHGFAHSCAIFTADTLDTCLVRYLCDRGFDVWLAELRTSTALESCRKQWSFDEIAPYDLPEAVREVLRLTKAPQVNVVAHCMGAAVFVMSALRGKFDGGKQIRAAVLSQIGPYVVGSPSNQLRAELAAFLEDVIGLDHIDVSAHETSDWLPVLADRLACTYPVPDEERLAHASAAPCPPRTDLATCNRITAVYGQNWLHENIDAKTHASMGRLLGYANMKTFRQITDFVQRGRVVFEGGINEYFLDDAVHKNMQFPIAFLHGAQSDVFAPATSLRAFQRLSSIQNATTHECVVKDGYGHLDLWLGRKAHLDVYPIVGNFLAKEHASKGPTPREVPRLKPATRGPILGWTRPGQSIKGLAHCTCFRVWWEVDASDTDPPRFGVVFAKRTPDGGGAVIPTLVGVWPAYFPKAMTENDATVLPVTTYVVADISVDCIPDGVTLWFGSLHLPMGALGIADGGDTMKEFIPPLMEGDLGTYLRDGGDKDAVALTFEVIAKAYGSLPAEAVARSCATPSVSALERITSSQGQIEFFIGSCRYPGTMFEAELAESAFRQMNAKLEREGPDESAFVLMVGDQIYADATAGVLDTQSARDRVMSRYEKAWSSPQFARLAARIPVYTTIDDHELWDNFEPTHDGSRSDPLAGKPSREEWATLAYSVYQASFGRRGPLSPPGSTRGFSNEFVAGGFRFFCLDSRTTREARGIDTGKRDYQIVDPRALTDLLAWLRNSHDSRPQFVLSGSVLAPLWREGTLHPAYRRRDDGWGGYRATLQEVIDAIATLPSVRNVVFLSGDFHCSMVARLDFYTSASEKPAASGLSITASPFYAPLPFANGEGSDYLAKHTLPTLNGNVLDYQASHFVDVDGDLQFRNGGFTRVGVVRKPDHWLITVYNFDASTGAEVSQGEFPLPASPP